MVLGSQPCLTGEEILVPETEWERMHSVAGLWVSSVAVTPDITPAFCRPLRIREAAFGKRQIDDSWWQEIIDQPWAANYLIAGLHSMENSDWPELLLSS